MNITHNEFISNRTSLFAAQETNQSKYLIPDYFLASSSNSSYYSRKYGVNNLKLQSKHSKIASIVLVSLGFLATAVEVEASDSIELQTEVSLPDVVPTLPLPDLIPSNPPVTPPPPLPLPDIVLPVILPDVVPVPPAPPAPPMALSQLDLVSDAGNSKSDKKSALLQSIRDFGGRLFKLKKVKQEPKLVVVSSSYQDLRSQLHNTLERRRKGIAGEEKHNKLKQAAKEVIVLTAEEQKVREAEIAKKIAENKAKSATLRKQKEKEWAIKAKQIEVEVEVEKQRKAAAHAKAMREQKAKESGIDRSTVIAGIDPVLHNNIVADLRSEISSLTKQLTLNSNDNFEGINSVESVNYIRGKRSLEDSKIVENKDQSTSTEDLTVLEDRLVDEKAEILSLKEDEAVKKLDEVISRYSDSDSGYDESLEDSSVVSSISSSDTNDVVSEVLPQSNSIVSETVQDELADVEQELQSQELKEEGEVEAVEDILSEDLMTNTGEQADTHNSTAGHQKELAKRASIIARARDDLRFGSKMLSKQIRHRLLTRDIGSIVAVSAGDEEQDPTPSYSIWSSGVFGGSKQQDIATVLGYSSRICGGSIGGEINFHNDLMFGISYIRIASNIKYPSMLKSNQNVSKNNTNIFSIYRSATLDANTNLHALASVALSSKDAKQKYIIKPKSKLFSFESHLNHKIIFQNNITLIPSIGFRYEYVRIGASKEQILDSYIEHHKRSKSSTLSGELGSRVLFTSIKLSSDVKLIPIAHISLETRIASTGGKSGQLLSIIKDIGGESTVVSGKANQEKLSTNIGGGIIVSHKNMSLEFLYDLQKQRRFKSHQGVLKLKVNL